MLSAGYTCTVSNIPVLLCRRADGFWRGSVIAAEGLVLVKCDIGMYPGHSLNSIVTNHRQADLRTFMG